MKDSMVLGNSEARLAELAERAAGSYRRSVENWLECAYVLAEARGIAAHGEWGPFLDRAGIPMRTAQRMLRVAAAGAEMRHQAHLGGPSGVDKYLAAVTRARKNWSMHEPRGPFKAIHAASEPTGECVLWVFIWQAPLCEWAAAAPDTMPDAVAEFLDFIRLCPIWDEDAGTPAEGSA